MISKADLDTVDLEIRDLIEDLNKLPFLNTTYSCAGIGKKWDGSEHFLVPTKAVNPYSGLPYIGVDTPYLSVIWESEYSLAFRKGFEEFFTQPPFELMNNQTAYYLLSDYATTKNVAEIKEAWNKVHLFILNWLAKGD